MQAQSLFGSGEGICSRYHYHRSRLATVESHLHHASCRLLRYRNPRVVQSIIVSIRDSIEVLGCHAVQSCADRENGFRDAMTATPLPSPNVVQRLT